jgi:hypothetical protein
MTLTYIPCSVITSNCQLQYPNEMFMDLLEESVGGNWTQVILALMLSALIAMTMIACHVF